VELKNYLEAVADAQAAIDLKPQDAKGYLRKGIACFSLEEYQSALTSFEKGHSLDPENNTFKTWIRKCRAELEEEGNESHVESPAPSQMPAAKHEVPAPQQVAPPVVPADNLPPKNPVRHEWYQTATHIVVSVFIKNATKEHSVVEIEHDSISLTVRQGDADVIFDIELCDKITPGESTASFFSPKVEFKLRKASQARWSALERSPNAVVHQWNIKSEAKTVQQAKNWDKIASAFPEEKPEGEEALNKVFQDIFSNGSDEQKKAMMKSFMESGGTVLSTNWNEVGSGPVKGSPPPGLEMHNWNENQ